MIFKKKIFPHYISHQEYTTVSLWNVDTLPQEWGISTFRTAPPQGFCIRQSLPIAPR